MDQQLILDVIELVSSGDESVVGTSLQEISEKMNLSRINYIQSDRQNIIFPGLFNGTLFQSFSRNCIDQLILSLPPVFFKDLVRGGFDKATKSMGATIKNLFFYDKVITPTHLEGNHWTFTVVNIKSRSITLYDSIKSSIYEDQINLLVEFLNHAYLKYEKPVDDQRLEWSLNFGESPLQNNTSDCGVFTCTNARHVLLGKPLYYTQEDAPLLRHRITFEILNNVLLPTPDIS
ncbi:sentrin-specific protease 1-like [Rhopalosiphum padi]|uniref:sentrin-specific protease 1-like n=1 Tax=Rhopalosiphum padi TaxID=40932 RepID=UPI00298E094E|nr:sentrin-specific protease 1-like [Rhopalosiphum padi]